MSPTSCQTAPPRDINKYRNGQGWIRTTEAICSRFTVCPLWPLGNLPILFSFPKKESADVRTRTENLLITNQLLCQLSHIGIIGTNRARTYDPLLVRQMLSQLSYDPANDPERTRTVDLRRDRAAL